MAIRAQAGEGTGREQGRQEEASGLGASHTWAPAKASPLPAGLWPPTTLHGLQKGRGTWPGKEREEEWEPRNPQTQPGSPALLLVSGRTGASIHLKNGDQSSSDLAQGCCEGQTRPRAEGSALLPASPCRSPTLTWSCTGWLPRPPNTLMKQPWHGVAEDGRAQPKPERRLLLAQPPPGRLHTLPTQSVSRRSLPTPVLAPSRSQPLPARLRARPTVLGSSSLELPTPPPGSAYSNIFQPLNFRQNVSLFQEAPLPGPLREGALLLPLTQHLVSDLLTQ